jgi:hypothetical protein
MKLSHLQFNVNKSLQESFDLLFMDPQVNEWMQRYISFSVSEWKHDKRVFKLAVPSDNPIVGLLGGGKLAATLVQYKKVVGDTAILLEHKVRLHLLGAELIRIKPFIKLVQLGAEETRIELDTEIHVLLPAPLNGLCESAIIDLIDMNSGLFHDYVKTKLICT